MSAAANAEAFTQPHWRVIAAGWWLDFENLARIRRFAVDNGYRLRDAARLMLALPYAWTRVDLLLRALLTHPLRAFTGPGKPAQAPSGGADRSSRWIPTQHVAVSSTRRSSCSRSRSPASTDGVGGLHRWRLPAGSRPGSGGERVGRP